jgi:hypothetical protein
MRGDTIILFLLLFLVALILAAIFPLNVWGADTNTISSTVVTDKSVPTANAPSVVVNNNDVCRSGMSVGAQTGIFGVSTGHTITDDNCERIKLARSLYFMGMKVAAVSLLCQDARVFDAMTMAGTPCPYKGKIGTEAKVAWEANQADAPEDNRTFKEKEDEEEPVVEEDDSEEDEDDSEEDEDDREEEYPGQGD